MAFSFPKRSSALDRRETRFLLKLSSLFSNKNVCVNKTTVSVSSFNAIFSRLTQKNDQRAQETSEILLMRAKHVPRTIVSK